MYKTVYVCEVCLRNVLYEADDFDLKHFERSWFWCFHIYGCLRCNPDG